MQRASSSPAEKSHGLFFLVIAGTVLAVFWPMWRFEFVRWDDDINITQNPLLTAPWSWELVRQLFNAERALRFEPLTWLCYRGLHGWFGFNPTAWHIFNLSLHVLAAALFYRVLVQVFSLIVPGSTPRRLRWGATAGAVIWAVHPLRAEPVAWATAATYLITSGCLLASFFFYVRAYEQPAKRSGLVWSWILAVAGYASYPVGITYGLWLIATDRWLLPEKPGRENLWTPNGNRAWLFKHALFLFPAALATGVTVWTRFNAPGIFGTAPAIESVDLLSRWKMAFAALSYLAGRFFWPVNLTPNVAPLRPDEMAGLEVLGGAALALLVLVFAWTQRRKHRLITFACFGFAALALPCLGWTERPTWPVDRYSYLVHLALVGGGVGAWLRWARDERPRLFFLRVGAMVLIGCCVIFTRRQTMTWRDTPTLFSHMEKHPAFARDPRQQAHVYLLWALFEGTKGHEQRSGDLMNQAQHVYLHAIRTAVGRGDYAEALDLTTHLEHFFPLAPDFRREKGAWLLRTHHPEEALRELRLVQAATLDDPRLKSLIEDAEKQVKENAAFAAPAVR